MRNQRFLIKRFEAPLDQGYFPLPPVLIWVGIGGKSMFGTSGTAGIFVMSGESLFGIFTMLDRFIFGK